MYRGKLLAKNRLWIKQTDSLEESQGSYVQQYGFSLGWLFNQDEEAKVVTTNEIRNRQKNSGQRRNNKWLIGAALALGKNKENYQHLGN